MGKEDQPKHRQKARDLQRRAAVRQAYDRVLIVSEGEKTEPNYVTEICHQERLSTAHVQVLQSQFGTEPAQVVAYAEHLFINGDKARRIEARAFDKIFMIFDRDDHRSYHEALAKAESLNGKHRNDERKAVSAIAIASVPCFELWLLLHFEDVFTPLHRTEIYARLRTHLPGYDKGQVGHWASTREWLDTAMQRAEAQAARTNAYDGAQPFTDMHELVRALLKLKSQ